MICALLTLSLVLIPSSFTPVLGADYALESRATASKPAPIVVTASQDFDGNDGPWSSFTLQIGSPAQDVKVLISTMSGQILAVVPQGCMLTDPPNCNTTRGGLFMPGQSRTWKENNATANGTFTLALETSLGYSDNAEFGYDTVALGWQGSGGPSLDQQIVGGIATKEFYLGLFALSPRPSNFTTFDDPVPSFIANPKQTGMIPSLSWTYSAGNQYRPGPVLGSLTLGGYDASRFVPNNVSIPFNSIDARDLTVDIESILYKVGNLSKSLSNETIPAFIDSTIPYLYLPLSVCEAFEDAFGLTWNDIVQAYLVNDTLHSYLQSQNATVMFSLGSSPNAVSISLPYAAFDLTASYPLLTDASRYFPLMRAANESQYTLGRTFLQEAYLIADYERHTFSVSQCNWDTESEQHILAISPPRDTAPVRHLTKGQIVGIAIGSFSALIVFFLLLLRVKAKHGKALSILDLGKPELDASDSCTKGKTSLKPREIDGEEHLGNEIDGVGFPGHEIDGHLYYGHEVDGNSPRYELAALELPATEMPH